jgi:hypothetical protein
MSPNDLRETKIFSTLTVVVLVITLILKIVNTCMGNY